MNDKTNKKILAVGSITACFIILLAGLSPVVGYNSARSTVRDSSLFSIRTKRAINQQGEGLSCEYIGKGNTFLFPKRDTHSDFIFKIIQVISKMDDREFNKLLHLFIHQYDEVQDRNTQYIIAELYHYKKNPEEINESVTDMYSDLTINPYCTQDWGFLLCTVDNGWIPGCRIVGVFVHFLCMLLLIFGLGILFILGKIFPTTNPLDIDCYTRNPNYYS